LRVCRAEQLADEARAGGDLDALTDEVAEQLDPRGVGVGDGGQVQEQPPGPAAARPAGVAHGGHPRPDELPFEPDRQRRHAPGEPCDLEHARDSWFPGTRTKLAACRVAAPSADSVRNASAGRSCEADLPAETCRRRVTGHFWGAPDRGTTTRFSAPV